MVILLLNAIVMIGVVSGSSSPVSSPSVMKTNKTGCEQSVNLLPCNALYRAIQKDGLFSIRKETLENECPELLSSFQCLNNHWRKCIPFSAHRLATYMSGVKDVIEELCDSNSKLRKDYQKNSLCLSESSEDLLNCMSIAESAASTLWRKSFKWNRLNVNAYRCLAHIELAICVRKVAEDRCGHDAGQLLGRLVERSVTPFRILNCHNSEALDRPSKKEEYQRLLF